VQWSQKDYSKVTKKGRKSVAFLSINFLCVFVLTITSLEKFLFPILLIVSAVFDPHI